MLRRQGGGRLSRQDHYEEYINPMEGVGNLVDAMLVLAVGMMMAVIMNWNVDFSEPSSIKALEDAETLSDEELQDVEANEALEEKGVVYQDPNTGQFYVKVDE